MNECAEGRFGRLIMLIQGDLMYKQWIPFDVQF